MPVQGIVEVLAMWASACQVHSAEKGHRSQWKNSYAYAQIEMPRLPNSVNAMPSRET